MNAAETILSFAIWISLVLSAVAFLLTVWRVVKGPTLPDRVVALDMLVGIVIGFIALIAIRTGFTLYIDIAIALGLVGFLATVAFARFILANAARADRRDIGDLLLDGAAVPAAGESPAPVSASSPAEVAGRSSARSTTAKDGSSRKGKTSGKRRAKAIDAAAENEALDGRPAKASSGSAAIRSAAAVSAEARPTEPKPTEPRPAEAKSAKTKPAKTKSAGGKAATAGPDDKSSSARPARRASTGSRKKSEKQQ
jgi:multicomponent Na+:H+ antiporter subunit F